MSKERGLLERAMSVIDYRYAPAEAIALHKEIRGYLDQPEQEPVGIVRTIGGYPDESYHIAEWTCSFKYLKDGDKLYLTPQEQEPVAWILKEKETGYKTQVAYRPSVLKKGWEAIALYPEKSSEGE